MPIVLDASAAIAYLKGEPGGMVVRQEIIDASPTSSGLTALISAVNLTEIYEQLTGFEPLVESLQSIVDVIPYTGPQVRATAALRPLTRHLGLSLADRACLALAQISNCPAVTADTAWSEPDLGVEIRQIRSAAA